MLSRLWTVFQAQERLTRQDLEEIISIAESSLWMAGQIHRE
jgi:hypothetical protein